MPLSASTQRRRARAAKPLSAPGVGLRGNPSPAPLAFRRWARERSVSARNDGVLLAEANHCQEGLELAALDAIFEAGPAKPSEVLLDLLDLERPHDLDSA